jgi:two-component system, NarL family, sensor histidine kinase DesK
MQPVHQLLDDREANNISPHLLWGMWLFWIFFLIQPGVMILHMPPTLEKFITLGGFLLFLGSYLWISWQEAYRLTRITPDDIEPGWRWWTFIGIMAAQSLLLPFVQGADGLGSFIYISACISGRLTIRQMIWAMGSMMLLITLLGMLSAAPLALIGQMIFITPAVGIIVHFFSRAVRTNQELRLARREIARLAVSEERLRFARDLHDLLGHTLSLITLKSELAGQLIPENPQQAQHEVRDIEAAARTALLEIREAVAGYRQTTLGSEIQSARELLTAAGIQCTVQDESGTLPLSVESLLAWVVREGITNVIRHSHAQHCRLSLIQQTDEIRMTITDDGQGNMHANKAGNGLRGISERVAKLDGYCEAGTAKDRGFQLLVVLPLSEKTPGNQ